MSTGTCSLVAFNSCNASTSGSASRSQSATCSIRIRIEFTFQLAIFMWSDQSIAKDVPQPQLAVALGFSMLNIAPPGLSTQSISLPAT